MVKIEGENKATQGCNLSAGKLISIHQKEEPNEKSCV